MVASVASENSSSSFLNIISDRYCRVRCRILEARSANSLEEHSQAEALRFARKMVMYGISLHYIVLCLLMLLLNFYWVCLTAQLYNSLEFSNEEEYWSYCMTGWSHLHAIVAFNLIILIEYGKYFDKP